MSMKNPPSYLPEAIPTALGWAHPITGEQLSAVADLANPVSFYRPNDPLGSFLDQRVGTIEKINVTNAGSGYTHPPVVSFSAGHASAFSILNEDGEVEEIVVINPGHDMLVAPTVTLTAGSGATASATVDNGGVDAITVSAQGSNYIGPPKVTIVPHNDDDGVAEGAEAVAVVSAGKVTEINVVEPGTGYTKAPTVTITAGSGATATASLHAGVLTRGICNTVVRDNKVLFGVQINGGEREIESVTFTPGSGIAPINMGQTLKLVHVYESGIYSPTILIKFDAQKSDRADITINVSPVTVGTGGPANTTPVSIDGDVKEDETLTAQAGTWEVAGGVSTFEWFSRTDADDETPVALATTSTLTLGAPHVGLEIGLTETYTVTNGVSKSTVWTVPVEAI